MADTTPAPLNDWLAHIRCHLDAIVDMVHEPQVVDEYGFEQLSPEAAAAYFRLVDAVGSLDLVTHRFEALIQNQG